MKLDLKTDNLFLTSHFPRTRGVLHGEKTRFYPEENLIIQPIFNKRQPHSLAQRFFSLVLSLVIFGAVAVGSVLFIPDLYYTVFPAEVIEVPSTETGTAFGGSFENSEPEQVEPYEPPVDPTLPVGEWVIIPRIGVRTQPQATVDPEEALKTGVWRVPDFGRPGEKTFIDNTEIELPMILAAHRYGWQWWWQTDYWQYHSFYNLPETQPGDRVEIVSNQRKWIYEIYAAEEGEEITDYSADLILYTCKFLNSPLRHFRYARLIDPTVDTQQVSTPNVTANQAS